jgi:general secretion pathway protein N
MIRRGTVLVLAACFVACGDARVPALSATDPLGVSPIESSISRGTLNAEPESAAPASPVMPERPPPRGNPLWAVPLSALSATRERPLFSPSRRPPPPAVVAAPRAPIVTPPPPKPEEPDHPLLTVVGTVAGESDGIGIFLDQATNDVIRLKVGQDYTGWILRSVQGRAASFEKDHRTATLVLPEPGAPQSGQPSAPIIGGAPTIGGATNIAGALASGTWTDGDGQRIAPPPARASSVTAAQRVERGVGMGAAGPPDRNR